MIYPGTDLICLHLPLSICNKIDRHRYNMTIDDLTKFTSSELLEIQGIGILSIREIRKFLQTQNKCLRDDILVTEESQRKLILSVPEILKDFSKQVWEMSRQLRILESYLDQIKASVETKQDDS